MQESLDHAAEKCLNPDTKKFFQSMVEHIVTAADVLLPMLDENEDLCERAKTLCDGVDKDMLRENLEFRKQFGTRAMQLSKEVSAVLSA